MMKRLLCSIVVIGTSSVIAASLAHAQSFKVEKFDIKGDGGTDYVAVESASGRVFVSRATHMMVVDGATGKVLGDIPNTPGVHGAGLATKAGHGFTTNGGDSSQCARTSSGTCPRRQRCETAGWEQSRSVL